MKQFKSFKLITYYLDTYNACSSTRMQCVFLNFARISTLKTLCSHAV